MILQFEKLIALTALCLLLDSCAQLGPPLPPSLELPKPPADLRATRKGNRVTLTWSQPVFTTDRQSVRNIGPTLVCRSPEAELTACGNPAAKLPPTAPAPQQRATGTAAPKSTNRHPEPQIYTDILPGTMQQQDPFAQITYAVEVMNRSARSAGLSNRVRVLSVETLPPPTDLAAQLTGDGILLSWTSASEPHHPTLQFRYRIFRRDQTSGQDTIAGEVPLPSSVTAPIHFLDSAFEWEKTYLYRVAALTITQSPDSHVPVEVEGDDSSSVRVIAHDIFPPSVPTGLQAVFSGAGQAPFIDLIWSPVANADLSGYNLYRSATSEVPVKLNHDLVKSPSYRDTSVASGQTYTYSVSAVDIHGNESPRSEQASEAVP